jgi:hypothetical protein
MDSFSQGYLEAAVCFPSEKIGQGKGYNISDIAPATRRRMETDCQRFQQENAELLMEFRKEVGWDDPEVEDLMFGGEFWTARNYQSLPYWASGGASGTIRYSAWPRFWSGEFHKPLVWKVEDHPESIGYALIEAAHRYGEFPLDVGKDNKIHHVDHSN